MPSIGIQNDHCVCYKPQKSELKSANLDYTITPIADRDSSKNVDLSDYEPIDSAHFSSGTFRITESGNYLLTEDIILDFHKQYQTNTNKQGFLVFFVCVFLCFLCFCVFAVFFVLAFFMTYRFCVCVSVCVCVFVF